MRFEKMSSEVKSQDIVSKDICDIKIKPSENMDKTKADNIFDKILNDYKFNDVLDGVKMEGLEPNRSYNVGEMRISTDDLGNVYKVNDKFIPNNEYSLNGKEYKTNDSGERFPQSPEGYIRPHLRIEVKTEIYVNAPKNKEGKYLDPNTGKPIEGTPDIGHKPGHEHWRESKKALDEGISQEKFNDRMNNSDYYQLEDPSNNRSHKYEDKSEYKGE